MASNNLHTALVKECISQSKLANACGLSSGTINRISNQKRSGSPITNHKIIKGLSKLTGKNYTYKEIFPNCKEF